jgi:DNA-binding transcriptional regulator YiaG
MSQANLATLIGVATNTVARWERGEMGIRSTAARLIQLVAEGKLRRKRKAER